MTPNFQYIWIVMFMNFILMRNGLYGNLVQSKLTDEGSSVHVIVSTEVEDGISTSNSAIQHTNDGKNRQLKSHSNVPDPDSDNIRRFKRSAANTTIFGPEGNPSQSVSKEFKQGIINMHFFLIVKPKLRKLMEYHILQLLIRLLNLALCNIVAYHLLCSCLTILSFFNNINLSFHQSIIQYIV